MTETTLKSKAKNKSRRYKYSKKPRFAPPSYTETLKNTLKHLIVNQGVSIDAAAMSCDLDADAAKRILFSNKPTQEQTNKAMKIYNKGFSLNVACVASGVSCEHFRKTTQERYYKTNAR